MTRHLIDHPKSPNGGLRLSRFLSLIRRSGPSRNSMELSKAKRLRKVRSGRVAGLLRPQRSE